MLRLGAQLGIFEGKGLIHKKEQFVKKDLARDNIFQILRNGRNITGIFLIS